jgi:hypothetical protein
MAPGVAVGIEKNVNIFADVETLWPFASLINRMNG